MTRNPFLDPEKEIVQGKSDEELLEGLIRRKAEPEQLDEQKSEPETEPHSSNASPTSLNDAYLYIPAEAFKRILTYPEYKWLGEGKGGIYVARKKLVVDSEVRACPQGIKDFSGYQDGQLVGNITWYEAKQLAKNLDSLMLTPAMLWCVANHLEKNEEDGVLEDILGKGGEWLDGIVELSTLSSVNNRINSSVADAFLYTFTEVRGNSFNLSAHRQPLPSGIRDTNIRGYFKPRDVDDRTGFPKRVGKNTKTAYYGGAPTYDKYAAVCEHNVLTGHYILAIDNPPDAAHPSRGMRLCKTPGRYMLEYLNKYDVRPPPGGSP